MPQDVLLGHCWVVYAIVEGISMRAIGRWRIGADPESEPRRAARTPRSAKADG